MCLIAIGCIISYFFFAPADTVKRPFRDKKIRMIRKITTIVIAIIYFICIMHFNTSIANLFLIALVLESIMINPLFYKLFKQPYANYKHI